MSFGSGYTFQSEEEKKKFEVKFGNVSMYVDGLNISDPVYSKMMFLDSNQVYY